MNLENNQINFNKICRICLKSHKKFYYLFETEAPSMLKFCGFLEIVEGDEFPDKICEVCNGMLVQSYELKQLCLSSKSCLQSLINSEEEIFDLSNQNGYDTANSNIDLERLPSHEEETSENELTNTCSNCKSYFSSKKLFSEHTCNMSFKEDNLLSDNESEIKNPLLQSENNQDMISDSETEYKEKIIYHCPHCKAKFYHEKDALVHQSIHSKEALICNACEKSFRTMKILKRHIKTHFIDKPHMCEICDKGFSESTALLKHERLHHLRLPRDKKYTCDECGQKFTDQYYLNLHRRKHTGEKPFECKICNKSFYDPRSFKVHMDVHNGTKPYLCNHCGKSFVQSAHLRQHLLVHTKEKPYKCNICYKSFTQSTSLLRHKKVHPRIFCCSCSKSFLNKKQLLEHEKSHSENKRIETKYTEDKNLEKNETSIYSIEDEKSEIV